MLRWIHGRSVARQAGRLALASRQMHSSVRGMRTLAAVTMNPKGCARFVGDAPRPLGNPGTVGLAGFGTTTILLQLHNLGYCTVGPVLPVGLVFGGLAQLIAGFQEFQVGNNFGYSAFTAYGTFWIAFALILLFNHYGVYKSDAKDVGWFLVAYTIYTAIMTIPAFHIHGAMASTFATLLIGFLALDLAHFTENKDKFWTKVAAYDLLVCASLALYMMAGGVYATTFGRAVLPMGKAWI